jgi:hypothetical protein
MDGMEWDGMAWDGQDGKQMQPGFIIIILIVILFFWFGWDTYSTIQYDTVRYDMI